MTRPSVTQAPLDVYGAALAGAISAPAAEAETGRPPFLRARRRDGRVLELASGRWLGQATAADESALDRARGPVIDLGCGPGRHLGELARRGIYGLGVDISPVAVALAHRRGVHAIEASVFDELPGTGRWGTALLLDGNLGIGACPGRLLARVARLLEPEGQILVEVEPPGRESAVVEMRLETQAAVSDWFAWALIGSDEIDTLAAAAALAVTEQWRSQQRWFARLEHARGSRRPKA